MRPLVPFDHERRQALLGGPHVVCHDGNGVIEPDNLPNALDRLGRGVIDTLYPPAEYR